jgi:hypothetical protein
MADMWGGNRFTFGFSPAFPLFPIDDSLDESLLVARCPLPVD